MRANLLASGDDAGAAFMAGGGGRRRWLAGLLGAAALLWPTGAAAWLTITARLNNLTNGKVEEATLLMNPKASNASYELPQFRLKVVMTGVSGTTNWRYTRTTFTKIGDSSKSVTFCKDTVNVNPAGTTVTHNFFDVFGGNFAGSDRKIFESPALPAGDYKIQIQAFFHNDCKTSISDPVEVEGILTLMPFQEVIAATVNGAASAHLQAGEKFDVGFTLKNNRREALVPPSNAGTYPAASAGVDMVEWLVAAAPPVPTADNHAPGMTCAKPSPTNDNFAGTFSSALPKTATRAAAVPANAAFGTYNLYLRVHDHISDSKCTGDYGISPVYTLENAIVVEPRVRSIRVTPSPPPPQPPLTVGKSAVDVVWEATFSHAVTGVDAADFRLDAPGVSGASIVSVSGSGSVYRVTTRVAAGGVPPDQLASLRLDFVDDDSVTTEAGSRPMGGPGAGNGDFSGETQALKGTICGAANVIWCDDFERSTLGTSDKAYLVGNGWAAAGHNDCGHTPSYQPDAGGCAGIDSDIKPYSDYANPRANSSRSMFNRWRQHTVTSEAIDLSALPSEAAVELSYWLRRGDDVFADEPDHSGENFRVEYLDRQSVWQPLAAYRGTAGEAVAGEALRAVFQLPEAALWNGFKLRFQQMAGSGNSGSSNAKKVNGSDYWFVDDVVLRQVSAPRYAGGLCDNFEAPEASRKQWSFGHEYEDAAEGEKYHWGGAGTNSALDMRIGDAGITGDVYPTNGSENHSMFLRWSYVVASSLRIDTSAMGSVPVSYVMQRGMKDPPSKINGADVITTCDQTTAEKDNHFVSEYFGSDEKWHVLQDVDGVNGSSNCGEDKSYSGVLTDTNARHTDFRLRFRQISKGYYQTGNLHYDYWLVDNVCVGRKAEEGFPKADLALTKTREGDLPPGGVGVYVLRATNNGPEAMRGDVQIVDTLPAGLSFHEYRGQGWSCETAGQVVTCGWSGELAEGASAPDLRIYAAVAETANGALTNRATLSSGAVVDGALDNNDAEDTGTVNPMYFLFTKGACANNEPVGGAEAGNACSRYRFGGLAGALESGIHITHVNGTGTAAVALSSSTDTSLTLQFALRCLDPAGPPPVPVQARFGASDAPSGLLSACAGSGEAALPWANGLNVPFAQDAPTASSVHGFLYEDVGRMELLVRVVGDSAKQGGSGAFVQKPAELTLENVVCADGTGNPGAMTADGVDGAPFCRAGQPFALTAAALSVSRQPTPNFGREATPKGVYLEKALLAPSGGHDPDLALPGLDGFVDGRATITAQSWAETGIITLTPRLGERGEGGLVLNEDYLGAGEVPTTEDVLIGRFYPDHFQTSVGSEGRMECPASLTCPEDGFFYAGQPFVLTVRACLHGDETCVGQLENYQGDFAADVTTSAWETRGGTEDAQQNPPDAKGCLSFAGADACSPLIPRERFVKGVFTDRFSYVHTEKTQPVTQTSLYIRAEEYGRDGVSSWRADSPGTSTEGGIEVARGRLRLFNQFGANKTDLAMPVRVEFWHCNTLGCVWAPSATDITKIEAAAVSLHAMEGELPEVTGFDLGSGEGRITLKPKSPGSVNVSINLGSETADNACNHTSGGHEGIAAAVPWLRAWNGVCEQAKSGEADPAARGSFGVYSGESRRSVHSRDVP